MKKYYLPFLFALPSVLTGTLVMFIQGIPSTIYIQNLIFLTLGGILSMIYMIQKRNSRPKYICAIAVLSVLFLYSSFLSVGIDGVHRWVRIGTIHFNAAFISLPVLLIAVNKILLNGYAKVCYSLIFITAVALFLQPDASMLSAFFVSLIPLFCNRNDNKFFRYILLAILFGLTSISWLNPDHLESVSYVENILVLAQKSGWLYLFCCILSLFISIWPFIQHGKCRQCSSISISLGLFFAVLILSTLLGNFPVPLIGYGISPIIGYLISVSYVEKRKSTG